MTDPSKNTGWLLQAGAISLLVWPVVFHAQGRSHETDALVDGAYLFGIGILFVLAYFFESESVVFRWLIWLCEHGSFPSGRKMAFLYAGLCIILGLVSISKGLTVASG